MVSIGTFCGGRCVDGLLVCLGRIPVGAALGEQASRGRNRRKEKGKRNLATLCFFDKLFKIGNVESKKSHPTNKKRVGREAKRVSLS
jgi:hypothetical protein